LFANSPRSGHFLRSKLATSVIVPLLAIATVSLVPASTPAAAASGVVKCSSISGNVTATSLALSSCGGDTGGSGRLPAGGMTTISWVNGKMTSLSITYNGSSENQCPRPKRESEIIVSGTVTADTTGSISVGSAVHAFLCVAQNGSAALVPKTKFKL
jgi:hypothetical protein